MIAKRIPSILPKLSNYPDKKEYITFVFSLLDRARVVLNSASPAIRAKGTPTTKPLTVPLNIGIYKGPIYYSCKACTKMNLTTPSIYVFPTPHHIIYILCAKYGFGPSEDFAAQTSDLSFCAIILGSRTQTSDPRICCANLRSARNLLGSRNQTSAIRGNKPTIDRARKAARHTRQRSHERSRTQSS